MKMKTETKADRAMHIVGLVLSVVVWGVVAFMISPIAGCAYALLVAGLFFFSRYRKRHPGHANAKKAKTKEQLRQEELCRAEEARRAEERRQDEERQRREKEEGQRLYAAWKEANPEQVQKLQEWKDRRPFIPDVLTAYYREYDLRDAPHGCNWIAQLENRSLSDTVRDYISLLSICDSVAAIGKGNCLAYREMLCEYPNIDVGRFSLPDPGRETYLLAMDAGVAAPEEREEIAALLEKYQISVFVVENAELSRWPITVYQPMTDWLTGEVCEFQLEDAGWDNDTTYDELIFRRISKPEEGK